MFSLSTFFGAEKTQSCSIELMNVSNFEEGLKNVEIQLIDVRTKREYDKGHIENALLIDYYLEGFSEQIKELNRDKSVYIYCRSGNRSNKAAKILVEIGFNHVVDLKGGYSNWIKR